MRAVRRLLAFSILVVLVFAGYLAMKGLSGFDPLKINGHEVLSLFTKQGRSALTSLTSEAPKAITKLKPSDNASKPVLLHFALVADIHNDTDHLAKALKQAQGLGVAYVVALGDFTQVGTVEELQAVKAVFDKVGLVYYPIPGDHDMWDNKNKGQKATANFEQVFGKSYYEKQINGIWQMFVNNANLDSGIDKEEMAWLKASLGQANQTKTNLPIIIFVHQPVYHPSTSHIMGRTSTTAANQTNELLTLFADQHVTTVVAGDIHFFTQYTEPTSQIAMTTVGAVTQARNVQTPRFAIMTIYADGSYDIVDTEIK